MMRLLIVHEARLMADLTANALRLEPDLHVVAGVQTAAAALALLKQTKCDVLLVSVTFAVSVAAPQVSVRVDRTSRAARRSCAP